MLTTKTRHKWVISIIITFIILFICILLITDPIPQDPAYHLLADKGQWFMIPNFADVISNLPFATTGLAGLFLCLRNNRETSLSWLVFFVGLVFVAAGSSYYHWHPNNQTLVWDRLPMTVCFMSLFVALLSENVSARFEKSLLPAAILLGVSSVIYWRYTGDLRFYAFIQFGTLMAIPAILCLYKSQYSHRHYLLYGLLFYILAKVFELNDKFIFELSGQLFSGHTVKHLFAAAATYCVYLMLKKRHRY